MDCLHLLISGHVQGVSFRAHTQKKSLELGLTGWVRNLPDGRVEVQAHGPKDKLEILHQWAGQGPTAARVTEVKAEWMQAANSETTFSIRY